MSRRGWVLFTLLGVVWGVPYLLIRVAVLELDPLLVAFGRCLIGAVVLLPVVVLQRGAISAALARWRPLVAFALIEIAGPWLLLAHAETRLTSSTAGLLVAMTPLLAALILALLGADRLDRRRAMGLGLGVTGVALLVGLNVDLSELPAVGAVALTALGYAVGPILLGRYLSDAPPLGVVTVSLIVATAFYAPFVPFSLPTSPVSSAALWSVATLGIVCTALAFLAFFALVAKVGPARATVVAYLNPAVAVTLGVAVLDEPLSAGILLGFPLVIAGSILATTAAAPAATAQSVPSGSPPMPPDLAGPSVAPEACPAAARASREIR